MGFEPTLGYKPKLSVCGTVPPATAPQIILAVRVPMMKVSFADAPVTYAWALPSASIFWRS